MKSSTCNNPQALTTVVGASVDLDACSMASNKLGTSGIESLTLQWKTLGLSSSKQIIAATFNNTMVIS